MVVQVINVESIMLGKAKNDPPVCTNRNRPKTFRPALERLQPEAGHIHIGGHPDRIEPCQNIAALIGVFGYDAARVVLFMEALQSLVRYGSYHCEP